MQKYLVSQLKRGYLLYGRYFSKTLSLSRFKRVLSLLWFSAVPLPLGTPEHPILPVTHTKYPLSSSLCWAPHALVPLLKAPFCTGFPTPGNHSPGYPTAGAQLLFCGLGCRAVDSQDLVSQFCLLGSSTQQCSEPAQGAGFACWGQTLSCLSCAKCSLLNSGLALAVCD